MVDIAAFLPLAAAFAKTGSAALRRRFINLIPFPPVARVKKLIDDMWRMSSDLYDTRRAEIEKETSLEGSFDTPGVDILTKLGTCS